MNYPDFKNRWLGSRVDYDGLYGYQCVDLIKIFADQQFGIKPGAWGNAIDYWTNTNPGMLTAFKKVVNTPEYVAPQGTIVIFKPVTGNIYGHIAIIDTATTTSMVILEQNGGAGTGTGIGVDAIRLRTIGYNNVAGFLEPINGGNTVDTSQIIANAPNWRARCDRTMLFCRGRYFASDAEFNVQVGRKFINFVEDAESGDEAEGQLKRADCGKHNIVLNDNNWRDLTGKMMVAARGVNWGAGEFEIQVGRYLNQTASDIFSGPSYIAHQKRILDTMTENTALKAKVQQLEQQLSQVSGGGIDATTKATINETNSIVLGIDTLLKSINSFLRAIFKGQ